MSPYFYLLFPVASVITAICVLCACMWRLYRIERTELAKEAALIFSQIDLARLWEEGGGTGAVEKIINQRLDALVANFKMQIPLSGMFLTPAKEEVLKDSARQELFKLIPSLKKRLTEGLSTLVSQREFTEMLIQKNGPIAKLVRSLWNRLKYQMLGTAIAVGLVIGGLEAILFYFFQFGAAS